MCIVVSISLFKNNYVSFTQQATGMMLRMLELILSNVIADFVKIIQEM